LSCFDTIPACDEQTDGQTDVQPIAITCAVRLTHVENSSENLSIYEYDARLV